MTHLAVNREASASDTPLIARIQIGDLELAYPASTEGRPIELSHLELEFLSVLAAERDRILSYEFIRGRMWKPPAHGSVRHLNVIAHRLRRKISGLLAPYEIRNVRGRGYGLIRGLGRDGTYEGSAH